LHFVSRANTPSQRITEDLLLEIFKKMKSRARCIPSHPEMLHGALAASALRNRNCGTAPRSSFNKLVAALTSLHLAGIVRKAPALMPGMDSTAMSFPA
jgi:hypothetical protein